MFRAESYDTMLAWYEDVKVLTEKSGEERNAFVRRHVRSTSQSSAHSVSSDGGLEEDEADRVPYSANQSIVNESVRSEIPQRPSPGGRFPSDVQIDRNLQTPLSPSSNSSEVGHDITSASGGLQGAYAHPDDLTRQDPTYPHQQNKAQYPSHNTYADYFTPSTNYQQAPAQSQTLYSSNPVPNKQFSTQDQTLYSSAPAPNNYQPSPNVYQPPLTQAPPVQQFERHDSTYGNWMAPAAGGVAAGALGAEAYHQHQQNSGREKEQQPLTKEINEASQTDRISAVPVPVGAPATTAAQAPVTLPVESEPNSLATTPATIHKSFLGLVEPVPAAVSTNVTNGGTVPTDTDKDSPGIRRQNTDFSVSDLHVPGEYPRIPNV